MQSQGRRGLQCGKSCLFKIVSFERNRFDVSHILKKKKDKCSLMYDNAQVTYTGHTVLQTLVRARFSPKFTTGQRYFIDKVLGSEQFIDKVWDQTVHDQNICTAHRAGTYILGAPQAGWSSTIFLPG